jgi:hypothetical protein
MGVCSNSADTIANLLLHKIKIGISSRSIGSVKKNKNGIDEVQSDLQILCWDFVSVPSTHLSWICATEEEAKALAPHAPEPSKEPVRKNGNGFYDKLSKFMA